jgi:hypothetical protein
MKNAEKQFPFPPYGEMTDGLQSQLESYPLVPADLCMGAPTDDEAREQWWLNWRMETVRLIADSLWPEWLPKPQEWEGASRDGMVELTRTDLRITIGLWNTMLKVKPAIPSASPDCPAHITFFRKEDDDDWFELHRHYDAALAPDVRELVREVYNRRAFAKCGSIHLQFKGFFQRPRPFTTAFLLEDRLRPLRSITAGSPSLCSGHALQSLLGIGAVIEQFALDNIQLPPASGRVLRQLAVDIGDRRVFAGVHYPSDNLASWIICLRLANYLFRTVKAKQWLWTAIARQSKVYEAISAHGAYGKALELLHRSAEGITLLEE